MSAQLRVAIEFAESDGEAQYIRLDHTETVMPANTEDESGVDLAVLVKATLQRMLSDLAARADAQLTELERLLEAAK